MRSYLCAAAVAVVLGGCGSGGGDAPAPSDNHGYGFAFDVQGATGMRLRYAPILTAADVQANPALYEKEFAQVRACMGVGVEVPAPFVVLVEQSTLGAAFALTYSAPSLVVVGSTTARNGAGSLAPEVWRHEFVHYLLDVTTGGLDQAHTSKYFEVPANGGCA